MSVVVFVAESGHIGANGGRLQPAYRAWADALLSRYARNIESPKIDAVDARSTARIARSEKIASYDLSIQVERASCLVAKSSDLMRLYFPPSWPEGLLEHLADIGFSRDLCEELIMPCAAPFVPIGVTSMSEVLSQTPQDLLQAVVTYFEGDISEYISSLGTLPLTGMPPEDSEILITPAG